MTKASLGVIQKVPSHKDSAELYSRTHKWQGAASVELLQALAGNPSLSETLQLELAIHKDTKVREKLAANENRSDDIERKLLKDSEASVRAALIRDYGWIDDETELQLAQDSALSVRLALASNDWLRKTTQLILARDPKKEVRARLLEREDGVPRGLKRMTQEILAHDSDVKVRELLAAYPNLEPSAQLLLAADDSASIRKALAKGNGEWFGSPLSEEVQVRLAKDRDSDVRLALAENAEYKLAVPWRLYSAFDIMTGEVMGRITQRHRAKDFLDFLRQIDKNTPAELDLHVILDNSSTHKTPAIKAWLEKHPRFKLHFTPTSASWLKAVCWRRSRIDPVTEMPLTQSDSSRTISCDGFLPIGVGSVLRRHVGQFGFGANTHERLGRLPAAPSSDWLLTEKLSGILGKYCEAGRTTLERR